MTYSHDATSTHEWIRKGMAMISHTHFWGLKFYMIHKVLTWQETDNLLLVGTLTWKALDFCYTTIQWSYWTLSHATKPKGMSPSRKALTPNFWSSSSHVERALIRRYTCVKDIGLRVQISMTISCSTISIIRRIRHWTTCSNFYDCFMLNNQQNQKDLSVCLNGGRVVARWWWRNSLWLWLCMTSYNL